MLRRGTCAYRIVERNRNRTRCAPSPLLHDAMAAALSNRRESVLFPESGTPQRRTGHAVYPTGTSTCVTKISLWNRRLTSDGSAVSKNRVSASTRFSRASSTDDPWLAMSSPGHNETNPSSSRPMMAVKRSGCGMIRVYQPISPLGSIPHKPIRTIDHDKRPRPLPGSSFRPSCSCTAVKTDGPPVGASLRIGRGSLGSELEMNRVRACPGSLFSESRQPGI